MIHFHHAQQHVFRNNKGHSYYNNRNNHYHTMRILAYDHQEIICNGNFYFSFFSSWFLSEIILRSINPDKPKFCINMLTDSFKALSPR